MTESARWLYDSSTMTDSQFHDRYAISQSDIAATNARLDRIAAHEFTFNHDWLRRHGWRCGIWANYVALLPEQVEHICAVAGQIGEAELLIGNFSDRNGRIFRIPADDPVHVDYALKECFYICLRIIPVGESFAIVHMWDEIVCYAAPPDLLPTLSLHQDAAAEKAHLDRFAAEVYDHQYRGLLPDALAANDGFWWWQ